MSDLIPHTSITAKRLIAHARQRYYRQQIFQVMRRKLHWAILFLIFTREAWGAESDLVASPVLGLVQAPTPALLNLAAMLAYLLVAALWFTWQRTSILGGEFRGYLASLPLDTEHQLQLDRRQIRSAGLVLMLPQVLATMMVLHDRPTMATLASLLTALAATVLLIWQLGEAVVWRKRSGQALCLIIGSLLAVGTSLPLWPRMAERCLLAGLPWLLPTLLASHRAMIQPKHRLALPFVLPSRLKALYLLPFAILWRANRSALLARTAMAAASLILVCYAVLVAGMTDRAQGFAISALAFSQWVLAGLYETLAAARANARYWGALPLPAWWTAAGELLAVCGLGLFLFSPFLLALHAQLPNPLLLGAVAIVQLALLRQIGTVPANWRNVSMLLALLVWSLALENLP